MIAKYRPNPVPTDVNNSLVSYVYRELVELSLKLRQPLIFDERTVAISKPVEGQVEFADGTSWNPGGGKGLYIYYSATWNKLG